MTTPPIQPAKRILLDENIDTRLRFHLTGHGFEIQTVRYAGLLGYKNGKLLKAVEGNFDVLVTLDKSIEYQNNFNNRQLSVLIIRSISTRLRDILPLPLRHYSGTQDSSIQVRSFTLAMV